MQMMLMLLFALGTMQLCTAVSDAMFIDKIANIPADIFGRPFNLSLIKQCPSYDAPSGLQPHQIHIVVPSTAGFSSIDAFPIHSVQAYAAFHGYHFHALDHMNILQTFSRKFNVRLAKDFAKSMKPVALLCKSPCCSVSVCKC